jgi:hypothetical protein
MTPVERKGFKKFVYRMTPGQRKEQLEIFIFG